jgi:ferredoxin
MTLIQEIDYGTPASKAEKTVRLVIDGNTIEVPEGTSVMRASMEAGIQVPKLCATDMVDAFGSCRLCLVEIEGRNGTPASCTTPVSRRHGGPHPDRTAEGHPPRRDGALYIRPSARLPDLRGKWRLRAPGHGRRCGPARRALRI